MGSRIKRPSIRKLARRIAAKAISDRTQREESTEPVLVEFEGYSPQEIEPGVSLLQAALRMKVDLLVVLDGPENLSKPLPREEMVLGFGRVEMGERLGCQSRIRGPVRVRIPEWFQGE
jgi:ferredoxin